jgi:N-acetyl-anhydromuramyl-L-alanine amidase AmpD
MHYRLLFAFACVCTLSFSQIQAFTENAYSQFPDVPRGVLEAVSFVQTRCTHLDGSTAGSCAGLPQARGYLGLIADGRNYFRENLTRVSQLSGIAESHIVSDPQLEFNAYASAYSQLAGQKSMQLGIPASSPQLAREVLLQLSCIPDSGLVNDFARNSELLEIFRFLAGPQNAQRFGFPIWHVNLPQLFGSNYGVLSASRVTFSETGIADAAGHAFSSTSTAKSTEYGPAIWNAAPSCNYSSRNGTAISAITIHTIQGTYAGAISWSQNCSSSVSYHYVIRSSDGQITQMVQEAGKAWHVGSENPYTIGYEHEGYVDQPQWYTEAMYQASADLSRDIVGSGYGIPALRTYYGAASAGTQVLGGCTKIKGHQHFANQSHTDPGINWNWEKYYRLINNNPSVQVLTGASGTHTDSGGSTGSYLNDERKIWVIQPSGAAGVSLTFTAFSIEAGYDKLFIYNGSSVNAPLIGAYTGTTLPPAVSSGGGALTLEFRSDCATVANGWIASWTSTSQDIAPPVTAIAPSAEFYTSSFPVEISDSDAGQGIAQAFALVSDRQNAASDWHGNGSQGYVRESFDQDAALWTQQTGVWSRTGGGFQFSGASQDNSNAFIAVAQDASCQYLYHWKQTFIGAGTNERAGIHFFCDNPLLPNRGNSYFVYLREDTDKAQIYEVNSDTWTLRAEATVAVSENQQYDVKIVYDPSAGTIRFFVNNAFAVSWTDPDPLVSGTAFSLRSGGCTVLFDDVMVYRSRGSEIQVVVGAGGSARYQSDNGNTAVSVRSIAVDYANNWSAASQEGYRIDWSEPVLSELADGIAGGDIDVFSNGIVSANWSCSDPHSGTDYYEVAVGTTAGASDILGWTDAGDLQSFNFPLASPVNGQFYYVSLRAYNMAGLAHTWVTDGQKLVQSPTSLAGIAENDPDASVFPNPAFDELTVKGNWQSALLTLYDRAGRKVLEHELSGPESKLSVAGLAGGLYYGVIRKDNSFYTVEIMIGKY